MRSNFFYLIVYLLGFFYLGLVASDMINDIYVRWQSELIQTEAEVSSRSRAQIKVEYFHEGVKFEKVFSRGILRFDFPSINDKRNLLYVKNNPQRATLSPPIGTWFFWTTDLCIVLAGLYFCVRFLISLFKKTRINPS